MRPQRVLLAVDGSPVSDLARSHATDLLAATGAELHVVHVGLVTTWTHPRTLSPAQFRRLREEAQQVLDAEVRVLTDLGFPPTGTHLGMGRAAEQVLRFQGLIGADLIVLGSRGRNAVARVLLGSDAEKVVRRAGCPVLVVREAR